MKCITVRQPWAWAIVEGLKRIENRTWTTRYRGPLLIHAGVSRAEFKGEAFKTLDLAASMPFLPPVGELIFGAIIGVVDLVGVVPLEEVAGEPFASGPLCWLLENPRAVGPAPYKGKLNLFEVDAEAFGLLGESGVIE